MVRTKGIRWREHALTFHARGLDTLDVTDALLVLATLFMEVPCLGYFKFVRRRIYIGCNVRRNLRHVCLCNLDESVTPAGVILELKSFRALHFETARRQQEHNEGFDSW